MDSLEINKIVAGLLVVVLIIIGITNFAEILYHVEQPKVAHYVIEGVDADDASNYTNRSPYPMLHLLREESVETALIHYRNPEEIPERNIKYTRAMGVKALQKLSPLCKK